ncbi:MAG: hypothetical protein AAF628_02895 [Planctomycetota bacterium]
MTGDPTASKGSAPGVGVMLFVLSTVTIALQIVQVRILSYTINHAFVYMAVSLAMLGFGLSGTLLSVWRGLLRIPPRTSVGACLVLFAVAAVVVHLAFAQVSHLVVPTHGLTILSPSAALLLMFSLPYLFAGMGVALALLADVGSVGRSYFVNLVGSAAGCFLIYPFFRTLGAAGSILAIAAAAALTAALAGHRVWRPLGAIVAIVAGATVPFAESVLRFAPDKSDQYAHAVEAFEVQQGGAVAPTLEFERWDPVGKIEVYRFPEPFQQFGGRTDSLFFAQDAGAGSVLFGLGAHPELGPLLADGTVYGLATNLRPQAEALIIGVGGAPDVLAALHNDAKTIQAAEINAGTVEAIRDVYPEFLGLPDPVSGRLKFVVADGRSWVRRFRDEFDVVQMTGADTYAASASGGSVLAENYLYTVEAFVDYLRAIKPDGVVSITRFSWESLRVLTTMLAALRELGVADPSQHVAILAQGPELAWGATLAKRVPFTASEIEQLKAVCAGSVELGPQTTIPVFEPIGFRLDTPIQALYLPAVGAGANGDGAPQALAVREQELLARTDVDFSAPTDDKPFFFSHTPLRTPTLEDLFRTEPAPRYNFEVTNYVVLATQIGLVALLLILGPLVVFFTRGLRLGAGLPVALYFGSIGTGFMLLEIALMQKCGLFLGHPNFSISTVLFSLLVFSGIGSYLAGRSNAAPGTKVAIAVLGMATWIGAFSLFSGGLFTDLLHLDLSVRIAIQIALIAPAGLCAGVMFPTCLGVVEAQAAHLSPWAIGLNGFTSVVASLAAIPTSLAIGFTWTLLLAGAIYLLAGASFWLLRRKAA